MFEPPAPWGGLMVVPGLIQTLIHFLFPWFCWDSPQPSSARAGSPLQGDPTGALGVSPQPAAHSQQSSTAQHGSHSSHLINYWVGFNSLPSEELWVAEPTPASFIFPGTIHPSSHHSPAQRKRLLGQGWDFQYLLPLRGTKNKKSIC